MQGISFMPLFHGELTKPYCTKILLGFNGNRFGFCEQKILRDKRWKYIWNMTAVDALYDMKNDPGELYNLIHKQEHDVLISDMRKRLYAMPEKEDPNSVFMSVRYN